MYKFFCLIMVVFTLASCNDFRCDMTHPDDMSPKLYEYCKTRAGATRIDNEINNWSK